MKKKKGYTENGQNKTGNTIYTFDARPENGEMVFVGNDGFGAEDWGKFTIQVEVEGGLWNEIENGRVDTEMEAEELVETLIADGFCDADAIRYEQI